MPESPVHRPPDRRVRRTHRRLKEALLELIEERDFDRITVEEITERADVARSTFYSHFGSKEDLLFSGFDQWLVGLADAPPLRPSPRAASPSDSSQSSSPTVPPCTPSADGSEPSFRFSLPLLRHMAGGHGRFARALLLSPEGRLHRRLTQLIADVIRRELERDGTPSETRDAQAALLASAFLGLAAWWLTSGRGLPPERIDEVFQRTVGGAP